MSDYRLGEESGILRLQSLAALCELDRLLTAQARREILLLSADLEPERFDREDWLNVLSTVLREQQVQLLVLTCDDAPALHHRHGLLTLARRLPSLIRAKQISAADFPAGESQLMVDRIGLVRRKDGHVYADMRSLATATQCREQFVHLFEHARDIPELRSLAL